jgi:hypothetical protein
MNYSPPRPFADPAFASLNDEALQDDRIHIEKINGPFLFKGGGTPEAYSAGLTPSERGWL